MSKRVSMTRPKYLLSLIVISLLYSQADPTAAQELIGRDAYEAIKGKYVGTTQGSKKVSSALRAVIDEIEARAITRQKTGELDAPDLSNPLVRVSDDGYVQVYIYVYTLGMQR